MKIIAEIGQNYNGNLDTAFAMIEKSAEIGADYAKFQLFDPRKVFQEKNNPWWEYNLRSELTKDDVLQLARFCEKCKIKFAASVFDIVRLSWLLQLDIDFVKIASRSINDKLLINAAIESGFPILASLGFWQEEELPYNNNNISYLHCVSEYPAPAENLRLHKLKDQRIAGYSDHSIGISAAKIAICSDKDWLEKHVTLDKKMYGPDHECSATFDEMREIIEFREFYRISKG